MKKFNNTTIFFFKFSSIFIKPETQKPTTVAVESYGWRRKVRADDWARLACKNSFASNIRDFEETKRRGYVGRLHELMEAKIVDAITGDALSPGHKGELWLWGPTKKDDKD